jgi:hypothetical protein
MPNCDRASHLLFSFYLLSLLFLGARRWRGAALA